MVQHGLKEVKTIITNVHESIDYINQSDLRLKNFTELVQQFNLKERRLVLECKTRWKSTYEIIKVLLDTQSDTSDEFIKKLVKNMKERFDKYWGQCNLRMAIGAVLDPRLKMKVVEITFPKMFPFNVARDNVNKVREILYELYKEYITMYSPTGKSDETEVRSEDTIESRKSEVDDYLDEGCYVPHEDECFDALERWKDKCMKFRILYRLAVDILAVPITTVASETTFSAGSRVIDPYRASLSSDAVQMLLCTEDWCRSLYGLKRKNKNKSEDQPKEIRLPLP
ncbi:zinc finger BED domain-containing protein DAYSLEEPER-like [Silene latifolia]|uniref:zinc finger BED domain-containing protein DAYSLEEPER-like n=1 Tax=Silene latifolia TaxID=37657 RepID=UPI003D78585A